MALSHINNCVKNCWNLCLYCQPVFAGNLSCLTWIKFDSSSEVSPVIIFESPLNAAPPKFVELPEPWAANRTRVSLLIWPVGLVFVHHWLYWPQIKGFNYKGQVRWNLHCFTSILEFGLKQGDRLLSFVVLTYPM